MAASIELKDFKAQVRQALGDYIKSEGCSCCQDRPSHQAAAKRLAKLLDVSMYADKSGYDFYKYATPDKH